jgi:hypothetical protein
MRKPVLVAACVLLLAGCRADTTEVHADLCSDLGHLAATVDALAAYGPGTRIGVVRGALEKMDPTFGNLSRSGLADPAVLDRLLRAHVGYRDLLIGVGDDETFAALGPTAPAAATGFRDAFRTAVADLACAPMAEDDA